VVAEDVDHPRDRSIGHDDLRAVCLPSVVGCVSFDASLQRFGRRLARGPTSELPCSTVHIADTAGTVGTTVRHRWAWMVRAPQRGLALRSGQPRSLDREHRLRRRGLRTSRRRCAPGLQHRRSSADVDRRRALSRDAVAPARLRHCDLLAHRGQRDLQSAFVHAKHSRFPGVSGMSR
jgi:hypothetical protein